MTWPVVRLRALLSEVSAWAPGVFGPNGPQVTGPGHEGAGPEVTDVVMSSAQAHPGCLFACVPGQNADGHEFAAEAVHGGAVALLCERPLHLGLPEVVVPSVRAALGPLAAAFWGHPSRALRVVGVTGTNGKTTTCALTAAIFEAQGWKTGVLGTLSGARTTPEAPELQRLLAGMRDSGASAAAMEVSSHALDQKRASGTHFAAAVFTNLSQDHLDYHGTMDAYFEAKAKLFTEGDIAVAVVNRSGPWGQRLVERLEATQVPVVTFAPEDVSEVALGQRTSSFCWRGEVLELNLAGRFNLLNAIAAAAVARELGVGWDAVSRGLATLTAVKGRFQAVEEGQPFAVVVDFAHTPAALAEALGAAREWAKGPDGRVIVVFGAGGDRDRGKRPLLGATAGRLADIVVLTSDNPRSEKPLSIIEEVAAGIDGEPPLIDLDRAKAIAGALAMARPGDVVLIAGKGHETGQDFGDHVEPFDDVDVARGELARLAGGPGAR